MNPPPPQPLPRQLLEFNCRWGLAGGGEVDPRRQGAAAPPPASLGPLPPSPPFDQCSGTGVARGEGGWGGEAEGSRNQRPQGAYGPAVFHSWILNPARPGTRGSPRVSFSWRLPWRGRSYSSSPTPFSGA